MVSHSHSSTKVLLSPRNNSFVPHRGDRCQHPRPRWPEVEAKIQVFFRIITVAVDFANLMAILIAQQSVKLWPWPTFTSVSFGFALSVVEIISLSSPTFHPYERFPRLPSVYLGAAEAMSVILNVNTIFAIFRTDWRPYKDQDGYAVDYSICPLACCVTREERLGITAYACSLLTTIFHFGFFAMAAKHWLSRNVSRWIQI